MKPERSMRTTDVLVAGAGPVGLMMACELRRHGVNCRIIDPLSEPANQCKALGIQPRTLKIWEDIGIVTEAVNAGIWLRGLRVYVNGKQTTEITLNLPDVPFGFLALPQYETERILTNHLSGLGSSIERKTVLTSFRQTEDDVRRAIARINVLNHPETLYVDCASNTTTDLCVGLKTPDGRGGFYQRDAMAGYHYGHG